MKTYNTNFMEEQQRIKADLKERGEYNISFNSDGLIISRHGKSTVNYWIIDESGELKCIDCKTI